ncbi:hypothetical protein LTR41_011298 [Exophiala xenobiotica]|nr:hypothetical protein LTR41_011298 [Exophiala xenobiotica]
MSACGSLPICKQNCSVATQWRLANNGQIQADADVVGAGVRNCSISWQIMLDKANISVQVIISFIVTAHATFIVVVLGYLTYSFEDVCTNQADIKFVECVRWFLMRVYALLRHVGSKLLRRSAPVSDKNEGEAGSDLLEKEDNPARKYRIEAFRDFMLALSDQQLVTGLAMLVAGFGRWSEISIYSANVVSALAFFSASVHMGTLDFLITYLRGHGIVKGCRVFAMMCTLLLLIFILGMQLSSTWWVDDQRSNLFVICAGFVLARLYVILILIWQHYLKLHMLYSRWGRLPQGEDLETKKKLVRYGIKEFDYRENLYKQRAREEIMKPPTWRRKIVTWRLVESFAFHEVCGSPVWQIAWLLYANVYGAILIFVLRKDHGGTVGPFNTMGFGQIVPVFLLVLLIFALVESVYGYTDAVKEIAAQEGSGQSETASASSFTPTEGDSLVYGPPSELTEETGDEQDPEESLFETPSCEGSPSTPLHEIQNNHQNTEQLDVASLTTTDLAEWEEAKEILEPAAHFEQEVLGSAMEHQRHENQARRDSQLILPGIIRAHSSGIEAPARSRLSANTLHRVRRKEGQPTRQEHWKFSTTTQKQPKPLTTNESSLFFLQPPTTALRGSTPKALLASLLPHVPHFSGTLSRTALLPSSPVLSRKRWWMCPQYLGR